MSNLLPKEGGIRPQGPSFGHFSSSEMPVSDVKKRFRINETQIRLAVNLFLLLKEEVLRGITTRIRKSSRRAPQRRGVSAPQALISAIHFNPSLSLCRSADSGHG
jgi:hypothetical protein